MPRARRTALWALLGILGIAAVLRFVQLGHDSVWVDEAFSARVANLNLADLVQAATSEDTNPPLYYLLLHGWITVFGDSEAALRSLSAVVGVLLVFVVFKLGERLSTARAGLVAALLAAVSEFLVHYSQEARVYSLLGLLSACSYYYLLDLLDGWRPWRVAWYVLATTALLYAHTYGLFVLLAQMTFAGVALLWRREWIRGLDPRRLGFALVAPLVLAIPWFVVFAGHVRDEIQGGSDAKLAWLAKPSLRDLPGTLSGYAGSRAALLAASGIFGVISQSVAQRTTEFGVRMAMGASAGQVLRMVLVRAAVFMLLGIVIGLAAGWMLARFVTTFLFRVEPHDVIVYAIASGLLILTGLAAAFVPARRASKVDPMSVLR